MNDGAPAKATALDVAAHLLTLKPDVTCAGLTAREQVVAIVASVTCPTLTPGPSAPR